MNLLFDDYGIRAGLAALQKVHLNGQRLGATRILREERVVFDVLVDDKHFVVKVDDDPTRGAMELAGMSYGAQYVPVPAITLVDEGPPHVLVYEYVAGRSLWENQSSVAAWTSAGHAMRTLHDAYWECPPEHRTQWRRNIVTQADEECARAALLCPSLEPLITRAHERMQHDFADLMLDRCVLLHGDVRPDHVILDQTENVVAVIDWADYGCGDAAIDLVALSCWKWGQLTPLLDGYAADAPLRDHLATYGLSYRLLRHIGVTRWKIERGLDTDPEAKELARLLT